MLKRRELLAAAALGATMLTSRSLYADDRPASDWKDDFSKLPDTKLFGDEQIAMLLYPGFTALDLVGPYHFFAGMMGAEVHLVTNQSSLTPVQSDMGLAIAPTTTLTECPNDLTILFVPGGTKGTLAAARDPLTVDFIRNRGESADLVTSVCTGALILGMAGLLEGRKATTHWSIHPLLQGFGAKPVNARVVQDGNLITGAGVSAGLDFGLSIVSRLRGQPYAAASMLTAEYYPEPPFAGGTLATTDEVVARPMTAMFSRFAEEAKSLIASGNFRR